MLSLRLHALCREWSRPCSSRSISRPACSDRLNRPGRTENGELERAGGDAGLGAQLAHELSNFGIGQRGMMADRRNSATSRQDVLQVTAPACRVFARTVTARCGPAENALDAPANPIRRLRFL